MSKKESQEVKSELKQALKNVSNLYKASCVTWRGITSDTHELYSEIIANELLKELKEFDNIPKVTRTNTYCRKNHQKIEIDLTSNRKEEIFAKRMAYLNFDEIGTILDYQVPLKDTSEDKGLGKIDLISYNQAKKTLFLIELKNEGNVQDTLLRAMLEIYTYCKIVNQEKLINDCLNNQEFIFSRLVNHVNPEEVKVVPAVLLVKDSLASDELEEMETGERPKLLALALALGIKFFRLDYYVNSASFQSMF